MMNSEQRLDRLERIAMLMARAGARVRREKNEKIKIIIDAQIANEDRFARNEERLATLVQSQNELVKSVTELAKAQIRTETRFDSLIEAINLDRNGNSG